MDNLATFVATSLIRGSSKSWGLPDVQQRVVLESPDADRKGCPQSNLRVWQRWYVRWLRVSDTLVVAAAVFLSALLRFGPDSGRPLSLYAFVSVLIAAGWLACLAIVRTRAPSVLGIGTEEYRRVWTATLTTFGCVAVVSSLLKFEIARGYLALALPLGLLLLTVNRNLARWFVGEQRKKGRFANRVLAIGHPASVQSFELSLTREPDHGYTLVELCDPTQVRRDIGIARALELTTSTPH